jgi:hypothetical protein
LAIVSWADALGENAFISPHSPVSTRPIAGPIERGVTY